LPPCWRCPAGMTGSCAPWPAGHARRRRGGRP